MNKKLLKFIATLSALTIVFSLSSCGKKEETETTKPETTMAANATVSVTDESDDETTTAGETDENETTVKGETTKKDDTTKKNETTKKVTPGTTKSSIPQTKAEIVNYLNTAMNKVKTQKAGFDSHSLLVVNGSVENIPEILINAFKEDKRDTVKKGTNSNDTFPAQGFSWSSKLTTNDVKSAEISQSGDTYTITLKFGTEKNPAKGASSYGRIMSVIDQQDAKKKALGLLKEVEMTYHDGYAIVKINSKTGLLSYAQLSATADVDIVLRGSSTHRKVNDIKSTGTYTNFVW